LPLLFRTTFLFLAQESARYHKTAAPIFVCSRPFAAVDRSEIRKLTHPI
jgi:hypothetical protein